MEIDLPELTSILKAVVDASIKADVSDFDIIVNSNEECIHINIYYKYSELTFHDSVRINMDKPLNEVEVEEELESINEKWLKLKAIL